MLTFVLALAAIVQPFMASAQETPCFEGARCRAVGTFRTCDRPLDGAKILSAKVLATSCSNHILSVQIDDVGTGGSPAVVEIDLGPCVFFDGKVGDVTKIALREPYRPDVRRYRLACGIW